MRSKVSSRSETDVDGADYVKRDEAAGPFRIGKYTCHLWNARMCFQSVKSTFHKLLILCCALYLSGAHWMILQTSAWTGMLISRSISTSVAKALETTLDGKHPCALCSAIADGKQTEKQSEQNFELLKKAGDLKFLALTSLETTPCVNVGTAHWPALLIRGLARFVAPPTPPPLA